MSNAHESNDEVATRKATSIGETKSIARLERELLLAHVLSVSKAYLYTHPEKVLNQSQLASFYRLLARRLQGEPIAYIIGEAYFWSLSLKINRFVLIPRPETELIVEQALGLFSKEQNLDVLDLGTGSGAIALALAKECPKWSILATDFDDKALELAKLNAKRLSLAINFCLSDWFSNVETHTFDLIVTNPPYISQADPHLPALRFEPPTALSSGQDGLDAIYHIIEQAPHYLKPCGYLIIEHGYNQSTAVRNYLKRYGFSHIESQRDLSGLPRVTLAVLNNKTPVY